MYRQYKLYNLLRDPAVVGLIIAQAAEAAETAD